MKSDEVLRKLPQEGFLKVSRDRAVSLPDEKKVALIRKGNELFNQKQYDLAKRIFLTVGYTDGLIRLGDLYLQEKKPLEALRMYWLAPDARKVSAMIESSAKVIQNWLKEREDGRTEEPDCS